MAAEWGIFLPMPGNLVISLDFELLWGVRDHSSRETYGANVLGGRTAIPAILELFASRDVHATWAVVGAVLCESKDELLTRLPAGGRTGAPPLTSLDEIGDDERHDPYHFGASLARLVASCPGQELGTHTFSHLCALEPGHSVGTETVASAARWRSGARRKAASRAGRRASLHAAWCAGRAPWRGAAPSYVRAARGRTSHP